MGKLRVVVCCGGCGGVGARRRFPRSRGSCHRVPYSSATEFALGSLFRLSSLLFLFCGLDLACLVANARPSVEPPLDPMTIARSPPLFPLGRYPSEAAFGDFHVLADEFFFGGGGRRWLGFDALGWMDQRPPGSLGTPVVPPMRDL